MYYIAWYSLYCIIIFCFNFVKFLGLHDLIRMLITSWQFREWNSYILFKNPISFLTFFPALNSFAYLCLFLFPFLNSVSFSFLAPSSIILFSIHIRIFNPLLNIFFLISFSSFICPFFIDYHSYSSSLLLSTSHFFFLFSFLFFCSSSLSGKGWEIRNKKTAEALAFYSTRCLWHHYDQNMPRHPSHSQISY